MIETLKLRNFKVLRDVEVKLRPLTVIVGPNGSGKSTILQALSLATGRFRSDILPSGGLASLCSRIGKGDVSITCGGISARQAVFKSCFSFKRGGSLVKSAGDPLPFMVETPILKLDVEKLASPSYPKSANLDLPSDGEGLSSVLAGIYLDNIERFHALVAHLKAVIPGVEALHVRRTTFKKDLAGYELIFDMKGAPGTPASAISDGTLLTLGLLTSLAGQMNSLILIDDLERGLHPKAIGDLILQLRLLQDQNPGLQIVATSHSPYLVDFLKADEILLTNLDEEGYAVVKPLTDHPDYERSKDFFDPGEFWSTVGEGWVTKRSESPSSR
jgi:predicted ATPase